MRHGTKVNGVYHVQVTVLGGADGWMVRRVPGRVVERSRGACAASNFQPCLAAAGVVFVVNYDATFYTRLGHFTPHSTPSIPRFHTFPLWLADFWDGQPPRQNFFCFSSVLKHRQKSNPSPPISPTTDLCPTAFLPHYKPRFVRFDICTQCQKRNRGQRAPAGEARSEVAGAASEVAEEEASLTKVKTKRTSHRLQ
jgi:hypothetical protein